VVLQAVRAQDTGAVVKWTFSAVKDGGVNTLVLHGKIKDGWHLYSTTMKDDLPNSRVTLDSSARASIDKIEEKGQLDVRKEPLFDNAETRSFEKDVQLLVHLRPGASDLKGVVTYMAIYKDSVVGPVEVPFRYVATPSGELAAKSTDLQESTAGANDLKKGSIKLDSPVNKCGGTGTENSKSTGLLGIFFLGILGGLVGLIMPCTFPMIPLTVAFFTKRAPSRKRGITNAFLYGFFIFLIYVLVSAPFYFLPSSESGFLNNIATNVWVNLLYTVIFLAFALSFFGLFEITLPSSISNSVDAKSDLGSIGGIFFMALTLVIVSFSCTGPLLGSLIISSFDPLSGGPVQLTVALAGFGFALGLPFALFALFPRWLESLPRSGSWMTTVKIVFGFIELGFALKYFSNADLVSHWGILKRETFFAAWILISLNLGLFLLGLINFGKGKPAKLTSTRKVFGWLFIALAAYLLPGVTNTQYANISLVSGFPPPLTYSWYNAEKADHKGVEPAVINDYEKALQVAKAEHKPILIDFTGWACVNCRKMEENVWPKPEVKDLIKKNFILVSLYVDDKKNLPDDQQFLFTTNDGSKKKIITVGDKFATLQSENFKNASQPLYVVISPDEKLMTYPVGYTPSVKEYAEWLQCGLDAFHKN